MANDIKLKVIIDAAGNAKKGIASISTSVSKLGTLAGGIATGGLAVAGAGIIALGAELYTSVGAAMEAQAGQAELAAVLKSTGGAAGMTADAVNALASKFQAITPFEDDVTLAGENMLLTFTNIGKDVFPMATEAMLNMAQKMGTAPKDAAIQLGKALNDPIAGISALTRVGVAFTDQQKDTIKAMVETGDVAGAQKIILAELEKEFGGLAVAAGTTLTGKFAILKNTFGDIQETIGTAFLPVLGQVADQLAAGLNSPEGQAMLAQLTDFITTSVIPAIQNVAVFVGQASAIFAEWTSHLSETTGPAMLLIQDALDKISVATGGATGQFSLSKIALAALKATLDAVTIAIKLVAIGFQAAAAVVVGWRLIINSTMSVVNSFKNAVSSMVSSVKNGLNSVIGKWNELKKAARDAASAIPSWLRPGSPTPFEMGLRGIAKAAGGVADTLAPAFTLPTTGQAGGGLAGASGGGAPVVINLTYQPMVSTASQMEVEKTLMPAILEGIRKAKRTGLV